MIQVPNIEIESETNKSFSLNTYNPINIKESRIIFQQNSQIIFIFDFCQILFEC